MTKSHCFRVKLKPDALPKLQEWSAKLQGELPEVRRLLEQEGVTVESVFLENAADGSYLIYYLRSDDLDRANKIAAASQHPIDVYHRSVMQSVIAERTELQCLLDVATE